MSPQNVPQEEAFLLGCDLKITTGGRYIGGFEGTEADQAWWLEKKVGGVERFGGYHFWGGGKAPSDLLRGPE